MLQFHLKEFVVNETVFRKKKPCWLDSGFMWFYCIPSSTSLKYSAAIYLATLLDLK